MLRSSTNRSIPAQRTEPSLLSNQPFTGFVSSPAKGRPPSLYYSSSKSNSGILSSSMLDENPKSRPKGDPPAMSLTRRTANAWALILLVLAPFSVGSFIIYGVRVGLPPMFIVGVAGAIINGFLLVFALLGPPSSDRELRDAFLSFVFCNCFFIVGAFAMAYNRSMISTLAVIAGVSTYLLVTRRRFRRLCRRRGDGAPSPP